MIVSLQALARGEIIAGAAAATPLKASFANNIKAKFQSYLGGGVMAAISIAGVFMAIFMKPDKHPSPGIRISNYR